MKVSLLSFVIAISTIALAANVSADQQLGAQVRTKQSFGYGKLVMTLKPSTEKGIVDGFFMLEYYPAYPNGWTEVDYEYVPGNTDAWRKTADGQCGEVGGNCTASVLGSQSAADFISVNIIGGPLDSGAKPDSQVFYKLSKPYFEAVKTYTIEFNPDQVKWSASGVTQNLPFMYQKSGNNANDIHQSLGMKYLVGREMYIWLNIYSSLGQGFGGPTIPKQNTEMVVEQVAFYPLIPGSCGSGNCQYSDVASMYSNFLDGRYILNNEESTFDKIWLNKDATDYPIYTKAANSRVIPGKGLVMKYTYTP
jgi:beta-glucanase (GH16 family)